VQEILQHLPAIITSFAKFQCAFFRMYPLDRFRQMPLLQLLLHRIFNQFSMINKSCFTFKRKWNLQRLFLVMAFNPV
jgi:hypothetical protein